MSNNFVTIQRRRLTYLILLNNMTDKKGVESSSVPPCGHTNVSLDRPPQRIDERPIMMLAQQWRQDRPHSRTVPAVPPPV
jgi:hypothetical protein